MKAVNVIWELSAHARAWVSITQTLPELDRQFSRCFPLMQELTELQHESQQDSRPDVGKGD